MGSLHELDDRSLVAAALRREESAWQEIFRRHRSAVERVIARTTKNAAPHDVEDSFGDFCAALLRDDMRKLRQWDPERGAALGTWLCLIASRAAIDRCRNGRLPEVDAEESTLARVPGTARTDDAVDAVEERAALRRLVGRLSATEQRIVDLYYFRELDPEEVAQAMGVSTNTIYARKFKVEEKLVALAAQAS